MRPDKIIEGCVKRYHVNMVSQLLGVRIRKPSKPAHVHPHGQIGALDMRRGDAAHIRVAFDGHPSRSNALGRTVASFRTVVRPAVELH